MSDKVCPQCGRSFSTQADLAAPEKLLSLLEVAEILGKSIDTLYRWRYMGKGPKGIKVGRSIGVRPSDLAKWMEGNEDDWLDGDAA